MELVGYTPKDAVQTALLADFLGEMIDHQGRHPRGDVGLSAEAGGLRNLDCQRRRHAEEQHSLRLLAAR